VEEIEEVRHPHTAGPVLTLLDRSLRLVGCARHANQHNITGTSFVSSDPDILRQLYHGSSSQNLPRIAIPELEALLEQGAQTITPEERVTIYAEVQKYLMDHGMLAPFYEFPYYVGGRTGVEGVKFDTRAYPVVYDTFKEA